MKATRHQREAIREARPQPRSPGRLGVGASTKRPPDSASIPRWRRRADERPDEILDAALDAFRERGFDATRVEDVARRAGISKAGLYLYFDSKEGLLRALIEREVAPFARMIATLAEAGLGDPEATLRRLIETLVTVFGNARMFAVPRIVLSLAGRFPEIGRYYRENVIDEALGAFARLHRAGVATGVFREADSRAAARAVLGPIMIEAMRTQIFGADPDARPTAERAAAQVDLLIAGLGAQP
jgi:AcrR family transcriptional regulator